MNVLGLIIIAAGAALIIMGIRNTGPGIFKAIFGGSSIPAAKEPNPPAPINPPQWPPPGMGAVL